MAMQMKVTGLTGFQGTLERINSKLSKVADEDLSTVAHICGAELRKGMHMAQIQDFEWSTRGGTFPQHVRENAYQITLPYYIRYLEDMSSHVVKVKGKPQLERWVDMRLGKPVGYLRVKPHPFVRDSLMRFDQRLGDELRNGKTINMFRRKGK